MRLMGLVIAMVLGASAAASAAPQAPAGMSFAPGISSEAGLSIVPVAARSGAGSGSSAAEACDAAVNSLTQYCSSVSNVSACSCQQTSSGYNCQVTADCN